MELPLGCSYGQTTYTYEADASTAHEPEAAAGAGDLRPGRVGVPEEKYKGLSRAEISDRLGVSRKCVSVFIERARGKFHLKTSLQLRHLAFRLAMSADNERDRPYWKAKVRERKSHSSLFARAPVELKS